MCIKREDGFWKDPHGIENRDSAVLCDPSPSFCTLILSFPSHHQSNPSRFKAKHTQKRVPMVVPNYT